MRIIFFILLSILLSILLAGCANNDAKQTLHGTKQEVGSFLNKNTQNQALFTPAQQEAQYKNYLTHYFSPWTAQDHFYSNAKIQQLENETIAQFSKDPGWGENYQHYSSVWMQAVANNMQMNNFPNENTPAIVLDNTSLRVLPTDDPSYSSYKKAGDWYPFDNVQETRVAVNTPVLALQTTKNKAWTLVLMHNALGWIRSEKIAKVNSVFETQWEQHPLLAIMYDHTPVIDTNNHYRFSADLGTVFPLVNKDNHQFVILIAVADAAQHAVIEKATVPTTTSAVTPVPLTPFNIAFLANSLLGNPYGWGGMYGYRDCSSTMADLFTPFGIWLPRGSSQQIKIGHYTSLQNVSNAAKEKLLREQGVPFLTLIHLPGHIMLYLGQKNHQAYIFQDVWGMHTRNLLFMKGRAVIGQTVVTPLNLGHQYINVSWSFISHVDGMTVL